MVVDNDGGGIFSFLPAGECPRADQFEQLFGTPHGVDLTALAIAHGTSRHRGDRRRGARHRGHGALATGGVHIVLVRTDRAANVELHERLHAATEKAISEALASCAPES